MIKQYNAPDGDSCKEVSYEYDALNFRTKRTSVLEGTVTEYAYGRNGALTYEKFTKNSTVEGSRTYAYLNDQIIGFTDTDGTVESKRYAVTDIQGSVNEIYNEEGSLLWKSGYTAFGELAGESVDKLEGVFEFHGMYTGCQFDSETGLTYHWNRWRSEDGANFITPDPARDGSNWFGYAGQNPVNKIDPNGLAFYGPDGVHSITDTPYVAKDVVRNTETPQGATGTVETPKVIETSALINDISTNSNLSGKEKNKIPGMSDSDYKVFEEKKALALLYNEKNQLLAKILIKYLNVKYKSGGFSAEGIDCSGLLGRALADMGYDITRDDVQSGKLAKGKVDWLGIFPVSDNKRTGILGMINFYKVSGSKVINHMNYGIGTNNTPIPLLSPMDQIIDATESDSMLIRNDGRPGQYFEAGAGQVNQTYAPFSSNTDVSIQGYVRWEVLEANYRN